MGPPGCFGDSLTFTILMTTLNRDSKIQPDAPFWRAGTGPSGLASKKDRPPVTRNHATISDRFVDRPACWEGQK